MIPGRPRRPDDRPSRGQDGQCYTFTSIDPSLQDRVGTLSWKLFSYPRHFCFELPSVLLKKNSFKELKNLETCTVNIITLAMIHR